MKRLLLAALLATGCGESALPAPTVRSISPNSALASEATSVSVQVDGVLPGSVDYDRSSAQVRSEVSLLVGTLAIGSGQWEPGGKLTGLVPSLLSPGSYDVRVSFADGRVGTLQNAFIVSPGKWPSNYSVDAIPNPRAGVPFTVTVHANGANGATFHGNVIFRTSKGTVTPALSDPFANGVLTQSLTIPDAATGVVLLVSDAQGHFGTSNAFDVTP